MTSLIRARLPRIAAAANWGRWVCRCPVCPNALTLDPGAPLFSCSACGAEAEIVWPPEETVYGIERLLLMRPDVSTRNWEPGETLVDLMVENGAHGIFAEVDMPAVGSALTVNDHAVQTDRLPLPQRRLRAVAA